VDRVVYNISYEDLTGSTELIVNFRPVDAEGHDVPNLSLTPGTAEIGISLRPSLALKTVPIVPDYQGNPATNYALTSVSIDPFLVELSGSAEALQNVQSVRTAPINLTGKTSSFQTSVSLLEPGEGVSLSVTRATVQVEIEQIDTTFTFEGLLIDQRNTDPAYNYELSTNRVDVTIRGAPDRIANVSSDLIRPQVHLGGLGPGTHEVPVSVALPSEVRSDRISPSSINVTVTADTSAPDDTPPDDNPDPGNAEPESADSNGG
jgi:YbbR domain-containing protein